MIETVDNRSATNTTTHQRQANRTARRPDQVLVIPRARTIVQGKSDGLAQENRPLNDYSLRLVRPMMKLLSQYNQTLGELVLLPTSSALLHEVHRQRDHIGIDAG